MVTHHLAEVISVFIHSQYIETLRASDYPIRGSLNWHLVVGIPLIAIDGAQMHHML